MGLLSVTSSADQPCRGFYPARAILHALWQIMVILHQWDLSNSIQLYNVFPKTGRGVCARIRTKL